MKFVVCKTSGKRVNGKGIKYVGERCGRKIGIAEFNTTENLISFIENYGSSETIIYKTSYHGNPTNNEIGELPDYTIEIRDDWRE